MEKELREISKKLDILIKVTALGDLSKYSLRDRIRLLDSVGMQPKDIADVLGKSPNHIRVELTYIRKQKR